MKIFVVLYSRKYWKISFFWFNLGVIIVNFNIIECIVCGYKLVSGINYGLNSMNCLIWIFGVNLIGKIVGRKWSVSYIIFWLSLVEMKLFKMKDKLCFL